MIKKKYLMILSIAVVSVLFGSLFVGNVLLAQSSGEYDPWIDINEDGIIDVNDLASMSQTYGTSGDPTKNVNVTNWPVEPKLFQETLVLKPHKFGTVPIRYALISETEAYLPGSYANDQQPATVSTSPVEVYNQTFIHNDIPTHQYQILGMPTIYLPVNISILMSVNYYMTFHAYLGKISWSGEWTELQYLGYDIWAYGGPVSNYPTHFEFGFLSSPLNITINAYERLAIQFYAEGSTTSGSSNVWTYLQCSENLHAIIQIPIVKNP